MEVNGQKACDRTKDIAVSTHSTKPTWRRNTAPPTGTWVEYARHYMQYTDGQQGAACPLILNKLCLKQIYVWQLATTILSPFNINWQPAGSMVKPLIGEDHHMIHYINSFIEFNFTQDSYLKHFAVMASQKLLHMRYGDVKR